MAKFDIKNRTAFHKVKDYVDMNNIHMDYYVLGHAHPVYYCKIECNKEEKKDIKKILKESK